MVTSSLIVTLRNINSIVSCIYLLMDTGLMANVPRDSASNMVKPELERRGCEFFLLGNEIVETFLWYTGQF